MPWVRLFLISGNGWLPGGGQAADLLLSAPDLLGWKSVFFPWRITWTLFLKIRIKVCLLWELFARPPSFGWRTDEKNHRQNFKYNVLRRSCKISPWPTDNYISHILHPKVAQKLQQFFVWRRMYVWRCMTSNDVVLTFYTWGLGISRHWHAILPYNVTGVTVVILTVVSLNRLSLRRQILGAANSGPRNIYFF